MGDFPKIGQIVHTKFVFPLPISFWKGIICICDVWCKLDGVGPVDKRPSTDKLHHIVKKKKNKKMTCDMWHVTRDTWHVTRDMFGGVDILSKF